MKKPMLLLTLLAFSLTLCGTLTAAGKASKKSQKLTTEVVSLDAYDKIITIKDEKGETKTATATGKAAWYIRRLQPGSKVVLTYVQDDNGAITINNFKILKK